MKFIGLVVFAGVTSLIAFTSCSPDYYVSNLEITQNNWDRITVSETYDSGGWFASKNPDIISVSVWIHDASGQEISRSSERTISIPDRELGDREALTVYFESVVKGGDIAEGHIALYASPKSVKFIPNFGFSTSYNLLYHDIEVNATRRIFFGSDYEVINSNILAEGTISIQLPDDDLDPQTFSIDRKFSVLPTSYIRGFRKQLRTSNEARFNVRYSAKWNGQVYTSNEQTHSVSVAPVFKELKNFYSLSFSLVPYESRYFKYYVPSDNYGVFTLKNLANSSDLDITVYEDMAMGDEVTASRASGSTTNELCYVTNGGDYYYVKVTNYESQQTRAELTTHNVDLLEVGFNTLGDYALQSLIRYLLTGEWNSKSAINNQLSEMASNVTLSMLKGDSRRLTQNAMQNALCEAFKTATNSGHESDLACHFAGNLAREIHRFN